MRDGWIIERMSPALGIVYVRLDEEGGLDWVSRPEDATLFRKRSYAKRWSVHLFRYMFPVRRLSDLRELSEIC